MFQRLFIFQKPKRIRSIKIRLFSFEQVSCPIEKTIQIGSINLNTGLHQ